MKKLAAISLAFIFILILVSFSQAQTLFDKGVKEFNQENYEEALPYFLQAREAEKGSSRIAFYVGLTYKFMEKYHEAIPYFKDAATLSPRVDDAVVELVDVQYHTGILGKRKNGSPLPTRKVSAQHALTS